MSSKLRRVPLHPDTVKYIRKGHPWVTLDRFSREFPKKDLMILGTGKNGEPVALLLNDPKHKSIKARVWTLKQPFTEQVHLFKRTMFERLEKSFQRRFSMNIISERQNFYLTFGEADLLPGLFIQLLGDHLLIQVYAGFWKQVEKELMESIAKIFKQLQPELTPKHIWIQERNLEQKLKLRSMFLPGQKAPKPEPKFNVQEFGIDYSIKLGGHYDFGLYTDMAAVRKKLIPYFEQANSVLNLYAYTGAFSLFALKHGCESVVSVDISQKYLDWLEQNIDLNSDLKKSAHKSICSPVADVLADKNRRQKKFDLIISDPPSASHDGRQTQQAIKNYEKQFKDLSSLLSKNGRLVCFLNTHRVLWRKFHDQMEGLGKKHGLKIVDKIKLLEDCLGKGGFPEGDYLKGLVFQKDE